MKIAWCKHCAWSIHISEFTNISMGERLVILNHIIVCHPKKLGFDMNDVCEIRNK